MEKWKTVTPVSISTSSFAVPLAGFWAINSVRRNPYCPAPPPGKKTEELSIEMDIDFSIGIFEFRTF